MSKRGENIPKANLIFLTGFMGSGKSAIGRVLAKRISSQFYDLDHLIESDAGMPISQIFAYLGEEKFREIESGALKALCALGQGQVVSLGGGALLKPENQGCIREAGGILIYLRATPETIASRVSLRKGTRPLLAGLEGEALKEKIVEMLKEREPVYQTAQAFVDTDGKTPHQVVDSLIELIFDEKNKS